MRSLRFFASLRMTGGAQGDSGDRYFNRHERGVMRLPFFFNGYEVGVMGLPKGRYPFRVGGVFVHRFL